MTSNPRDFREWMREVERQGVQLRGVPAIIQGTADTIREDVAKDLTKHPAAPVELSYQTAEYLDVNSRRRVRFLMEFPDVVFNTDGSAAKIQQYELWAKDETPSALHVTTNSAPSQAVPGATLPGLAATASNEAIAAEEKPWTMRDTSTQSFFRTDGFVNNSIWRFRARAIGIETITPGEWSEEIVVQMLADTTPPPMPTAPKLLIQRGTITASWDGQSVSGSMPPDFKYAILAHGSESSPTFEIARFGRGGGFKVVADLEYYDPQFFRLAALDESGNMGPWSEQAVGFTTPLVDRDIILSTIDAAKTHLKNINAGVSILPNTIITEHLVVTEEMTAAIANFLVVNADMINANSIWADEGFFGLADALLFRGDAFEGKMFTGGIFTGGRFQTHVEEYVGIKVDPSGILAYSATGGNETFRLDTATGSLTASSGTLTGLKYQTHLSATQGIKIDPTLGIKSYNTSGQLQFDISSSGATFTGTIKSGFTSSLQAVLSNNVYSNQPGVQFNLGLAGWTQPFVTAWATNNNFSSGEGMLHMSSARSGSDYSEIYMSRNGTWKIGSAGTDIFGFDTGLQLKSPSGRLDLMQNGSFLSYGNDSVFLSNGNIGLQANTITVFGALQVNGAKNFVMDHPTIPGKELLHGSTESPVSGVEYWGEGVVGADGTAVVELPEYFDALTKPDNRHVYIFGRGEQPDWTDVIDGTFAVSGTPGLKFGWQVKAERYGGDFDVVRDKPSPPDTAFGPVEE